MHTVIQINQDNAAFENEPATETARILRKLADRIESGDTPENLWDINGNKTGTVAVWASAGD